MNHSLTPRITLLCLVLGAYLYAGCTGGSSNAASVTPAASRSPEAARSTVDPSAEVITIQSNTQATLGDDVRIGAGNFHEEDYTPAGGGSRRGLTAGLWIYVRNDSSKDTHVRVHTGQVLSVPGYQLEVLAVEPTAVRLAVSKTTGRQ